MKGVGAGGAGTGVDEVEGTVDDEAGGADKVVGERLVKLDGH